MSQTGTRDHAVGRRWAWASNPRHARGLLALLMVVSVAMILAAMRHGPGMSPDSVTYAHAARSFADTGSLLGLGGEPLTRFPPGLPVILGVWEWIGIDATATALVINALSAALGILLTYLLARAVLDSRSLALLSAAVVGLSAATVRVFSMMWTEPLFSILVLAALLVLTRACRAGQITGWQILVVGGAVSLATTLRFIGLVLIPVAVLATWIATSTMARAIAVRTCAAVGLLSSIGLIVVMSRNMSMGVHPMGDNRSSNGLGAVQVLRDSVRTLGSYVAPLPDSLTPLVLAMGGVLSVALAVALFRSIMGRDRASIVIAVYVALYWCALVYSEVTTTIDPVSWRFTSPVFAPMVILLVHTTVDLRRAGQHSHGDRSWLATAGYVVMSVLAIAALTLGMARNAWFVEDAATKGIGYARMDRVNSPLARALPEPPQGEHIAVNNLYLAYWSTRIDNLTPIPRSDRWIPSDRTDATVSALAEMVTQGEVKYLAFFDDTGAERPLSPSELVARGVKIRFREALADGELWEAVP